MTLLFLSVYATQSSGSEHDIAIGIDLGTTYSVVSVYKNGELQILTNEQGPGSQYPNVIAVQKWRLDQNCQIVLAIYFLMLTSRSLLLAY